jgi:hypothetical protein
MRPIIQVGENVTVFRKIKLSESVRAAGRPGPANLADPTFCTQFSKRDPLVFRVYFPIPVSQQTIDFATQVVVFLIPPEILSSYHFFYLHSS